MNGLEKSIVFDAQFNVQKLLKLCLNLECILVCVGQKKKECEIVHPRLEKKKTVTFARTLMKLQSHSPK